MSSTIAPPRPAEVELESGAGIRQTLGRRLTALVVGLVVLAVACPLGIRLGAANLSWHDIAHAFLHYRGTYTDIVVRQFREPEIVTAVEVGSAVAVAGGLMQGLTRNPLADPGILGVNAGAGLFVVLGISLFGLSSPLDFVWFAFSGAVIGVALGSSVSLVGRGRPTPLKLTLGGVITGLVLGSATQMVVMLDPQLTGQEAYWAAGDVSGKTMGEVGVTFPVIIVGLLVAMPLGRALNGLSMGEDVARALGQKVGWTRFAVILATVLLAGGAVAAAGPIAFVGFAIPHMVRSFVGNDYRWILPLSAVYGAVALVLANIVGRMVFRPDVIPTGQVVSIVGGITFLVVICRRGGLKPI